MVTCPACKFPEEMHFLGTHEKSRVYECVNCGQGVIMVPKPFIAVAS